MSCGNLVCGVVVALVLLTGQRGHAEVLRWEYSGRLIDVVDPDGIFPDLRPGDPVTGHFQYDTSLQPRGFFGLTLYGHDDFGAGLFEFEGISLKATNDRTQETFSPQLTLNGFDALIAGVLNDFQEADGITLFQDVEKPTGYQARDTPIIGVELIGSDALYDGVALPTEINLEDYSAAFVHFGDIEDDLSLGSLIAAIFELNPVTLMPGDYDTDFEITPNDIDLLGRAVSEGSNNLFYDVNGDGAMSELDRTFWIEQTAGTVAGDTDLNGKVEFADFLALS